MKIGLSSMLFILFLGLQLGGFIAWPWIWVFAPLWISIVVWLLVLATVGVIVICAAHADNKKISRG